MPCGNMDQSDKDKNLLDLKHQRILNYINICAISAIGFAFSLYLAELQKIIPSGLPLIFIDLFIAGLLIAYWLLEIKNTEDAIKKLKHQTLSFSNTSSNSSKYLSAILGL